MVLKEAQNKRIKIRYFVPNYYLNLNHCESSTNSKVFNTIQQKSDEKCFIFI